LPVDLVLVAVVHWDLVAGLDSLQQNTPEKGQSLGYVWIVHPFHPLCGQRVRAMERKGTGATSQWVIQLDDQTRARIPASWAVPEDGETDPPPAPCTGDLWADVTGWLRLARMVHRLRAVQPTEGGSNETTSIDAAGSSTADSGPVPALLGQDATGTPTHRDHSTGDDDGQMAPGTASPAGGRR
jgi:hypothetical protein